MAIQAGLHFKPSFRQDTESQINPKVIFQLIISILRIYLIKVNWDFLKPNLFTVKEKKESC